MELTVRSAQEGDLVFANEPIVQVEGPLAQCQLVETALLNIVNFQTLIATKAARIRSVIDDEPLMEFGTRRAQEMDAAIWGTRAAVIGGANGTSNVRAGKLFGIPVLGTHAHSLVQVYGNDYQLSKLMPQPIVTVSFLSTLMIPFVSVYLQLFRLLVNWEIRLTLKVYVLIQGILPTFLRKFDISWMKLVSQMPKFMHPMT